jgi:hypothetical protein
MTTGGSPYLRRYLLPMSVVMSAGIILVVLLGLGSKIQALVLGINVVSLKEVPPGRRQIREP